MKRWVFVVLVLMLVPALANAVLLRSGHMVVDSNNYNPVPETGKPSPILSDVLQNPGFETGSLPPWTTNNWTVTSADKHSGTYSAMDYGNYWVEQDFGGVDVTTITSVSAWEKQDNPAIAAVDFLYGGSSDEFVVYPLADWTYMDLTSHLRSSGTLTGIRFWGYSGGGDQLTQLDDVDIEIGSPVPVANTTWGRIKALYP